MPAFVTPRREPESTERHSLVNLSDPTHAGEKPDPGEAWPLPKRLRVRLQTSAERFGKETDLDERLALAERLQVRASVAVRASRVSRGFVSRQKSRRFDVRARARGRARKTRRARAPRRRACRARGDSEAERAPALRALRRPAHARGVATRAARTFRDSWFSLEAPSGARARNRFRGRRASRVRAGFVSASASLARDEENESLRVSSAFFYVPARR